VDAPGPARHRALHPLVLAGSLAGLLGVVLVGLLIGPTPIALRGEILELIDRLTGLHFHVPLSPIDAAIVWQVRAPRVALGLLVGGTLALAGGSYQGVFRNPLADPYLLGVAAGAGLGATIAITSGAEGATGPLPYVPVAAFAGALVAVALTYGLGVAGGERSPATLLLAGVAISSMFTAVQTFLQLRQTQTLRDVYSWILGDLSTPGWHDTLLLLPYTALSAAVLLVFRRRLDVLAVGDEEAEALGIDVRRTRFVVLLAASLGTAAAVSVSGLIGFVGIIVPHVVRLLGGTSYRVILPMSLVAGAGFLVLADLVARVALAPAELPIGVVTAALGGPFFVLVLRRRAGAGW